MRHRNALCLLAVAASLTLSVPAAQADDGLRISPNPAYAGAFEAYGGCGFQDGETVDLLLDGAGAGSVTAFGGCADVPVLQLPLDIAPTTHNVSLKGETSGAERAGVMVVMPPTVVPQVATVSGGVAVVSGQFFAPGRAPMLIPSGGIPPIPGQTDANGNLVATVSVPPSLAPGVYPVLIQDDPWLTNPPPLAILVNPQPSTSPIAQPAGGGWILNVTSTLTRSGGPLTANGTSTIKAPFTDANGQLAGQGQLSISLHMKVSDASCHGESQVPFSVAGTEAGGMFHFVLNGVNASAPVTVTCSNGFSMPFALPAGSGSEPFDIQAADGQTADFDGSNPFIMVPPNFDGHSHVVLSRAS